MKKKKKKDFYSSTQKFSGKIQNRHLDSSILLNETGSSSTVKNILIAIGVILFAFIAWANILEIDEVASTSGEIVHQGDDVRVQHLIGGRVKKIWVKNGTFVNEGETLISLDPIISTLELESIKGRKRLLDASKIRLESLISGTPPDFSLINDAAIKNAQAHLYTNTLKSYTVERSMIINQIKQVDAEIRVQENTRAKLENAIVLIKEELDIRNKLGQKGLNPRVVILQLEKEYNDATYNLNQIPETIIKLNERKSELQNALLNIDANYMEIYSKELAEVNAEILTIEKKISIFSSNIEALKIKAPVAGFVHHLNVKSPGEIAKAGNILLTLIPTDKPMVARVKISSKDIGHIEAGQTAVIRLTTYDSRRYGVLHGILREISPSVYIPGNQSSPYYEGIIELEKNYLGSSHRKMRIFSGMTLTADIKTGKKLFIEYLLKPIFLSSETAFHER